MIDAMLRVDLALWPFESAVVGEPGGRSRLMPGSCATAVLADQQHLDAGAKEGHRLLCGARSTSIASFSGRGQVLGRAQCIAAELKFGLRRMMSLLPRDHNCSQITFVLDRRDRQWYKCCSQGISRWKCVEVEPSAWFADRDERTGDVDPFSTQSAQECFRLASDVGNRCAGPSCPLAREQCVTVGAHGKRGSWPTEITAGAPPVSIFWFCMPGPYAHLVVEMSSAACGAASSELQALSDDSRTST
eukprot:CAMPEP_0176290398 /NCGR_PEP_ID=MMETSP0121_2-20121125/55002_1 /TAXON_ID=160619 /ORGANISM="Kryptoperidinium foliaceum, Strain CCMP 1326" /LENGTH=245 /DNA_ID=CAMNT_0017631187 /DNA_START=66 /DNA_END=802 /DNA_ORIENTATION=+